MQRARPARAPERLLTDWSQVRVLPAEHSYLPPLASGSLRARARGSEGRSRGYAPDRSPPDRVQLRPARACPASPFTMAPVGVPDEERCECRKGLEPRGEDPALAKRSKSDAIHAPSPVCVMRPKIPA